MHCEESVVSGIRAKVGADDRLLVIDAVGRGLAASGEADENRVQGSLGTVGGSFAGFNVEGHIAAITDAADANYVAAAVDAVDFRIGPVDAWKDINIAAGFKHSIPEVLMEQRADDNAGVGNTVQSLLLSLIRCSEIDLGELSALPPEIASHYNQGVVDCKRPADERGRRINDLQLSGVMEQKSMEYLRAGFKRTHHVSPIVQAKDPRADGAADVDSGECLVHQLETMDGTCIGSAV